MCGKAQWTGVVEAGTIDAGFIIERTPFPGYLHLCPNSFFFFDGSGYQTCLWASQSGCCRGAINE